MPQKYVIWDPVCDCWDCVRICMEMVTFLVGLCVARFIIVFGRDLAWAPGATDPRFICRSLERVN